MPRVFSIPPLLCVLLQHGEGAWLVGGAANPYKDKLPRDYDILVPWDQWPDVSILIPDTAVKNTFGGFKFEITVEDQVKTVDIWPGDLASVAKHPKLEWLYHMKTDTFFRKEDYRPPRFLANSGDPVEQIPGFPG